MTEAEWLTCTEPVKMLKATKSRLKHRKLRLFAVACSRRIQGSLLDPRSRAAIDVAERFADGEAHETELITARQGAAAAHKEVFDAKGKRVACLEWAAEYTAAPFAYHAAENVSWMSATAGEVGQVTSANYATQAAIVRDVFGNPFHPFALDPQWLTPAVVGLAQTNYNDLAFERMPELADALEAAGRTDKEVQEHCRGPGPHVRGCWVIDLILGKE